MTHQSQPHGQQRTRLRNFHPSSRRATTPLSEIRKTLPLRVLSPEDWEHWTTRGYVIVRAAVPAENVERLRALLWEFEE